MAIDFAADLDLAMQGNDFPLQTIVYRQVQQAGTAAKTITKTWRTDALRTGPGGLIGLPEDTAEFVIPAAQFTSGFAGGSSSAVTPTENDTITVSGEVLWEALSVRLQGGGSFWLVQCSRRRAGAST